VLTCSSEVRTGPDRFTRLPTPEPGTGLWVRFGPNAEFWTGPGVRFTEVRVRTKVRNRTAASLVLLMMAAARAATGQRPFAKGRPDSTNGLSLFFFFPRASGYLFYRGVCEGDEGSWLGASNSRKCHDEDHGSRSSMRPRCRRPWQDARWAGHPPSRFAWERTASACAADSYRLGCCLPKEREEGGIGFHAWI